MIPFSFGDLPEPRKPVSGFGARKSPVALAPMTGRSIAGETGVSWSTAPVVSDMRKARPPLGVLGAYSHSEPAAYTDSRCVSDASSYLKTTGPTSTRPVGERCAIRTLVIIDRELC